MPIATFEMTIEVDVEYRVLNYGYKGDSGEPPSGPEVQIDSISIDGDSLYPEFSEIRINEQFHQAGTDYIYEHFEDLEEQNAPDPD